MESVTIQKIFLIWLIIKKAIWLQVKWFIISNKIRMDLLTSKYAKNKLNRVGKLIKKS